MSQPKTLQQYYEKVFQQGQKQSQEKVPSHQQLLTQYAKQTQVYETKIKISIGVAIVFVISYFVIRWGAEF